MLGTLLSCILAAQNIFNLSCPTNSLPPSSDSHVQAANQLTGTQVSLRHRDWLSTAHTWRLRDTAVGRNGFIDRTKSAPPVTPHCDEYWVKAVINGLETDALGEDGHTNH